VQRALLPAASAATSGHVTLLKQKALTAILRRLDALLFGKLLGGARCLDTYAMVYATAWDPQTGVDYSAICRNLCSQST
jgi:hypothetical protein